MIKYKQNLETDNTSVQYGIRNTVGLVLSMTKL